jgi:F5/8 type C domain-containing protein
MILLCSSALITLLFYLCVSNNDFSFSFVLAQQEQEQAQALTTKIPAVKIVSPLMGQRVPTGDLTISGISSDNPSTDCDVSLIWNESRPYQSASATGPGGENDFSNWTYTFTDDYHRITKGVNRLTSKITCTNATPGEYGIKWYSVNVIGDAVNSSNESINSDENEKVTIDKASAATLSPSGSVAAAAANDACSTKNVTIADVKAIGYDGDDAFAANAYDHNLETRWSHEGTGSWIQFDLGSQNLICSMDIAWYKGDERSSTFSIDLSADGTNFEKVYEGTSSGTRLTPETYNFARSTPARFVKLIVDGNTDDFSDLTDWAAVTEVKIN